MATVDGQSDMDSIAVVAHETAVLIRRAESARKGARTLDWSAYLLLDAIAAHNQLAVGSLAEHFQLDMSTVSRQVATLEADGFVARCPDPGDRRVCLLAITRSGATQLQATRGVRRGLPCSPSCSKTGARTSATRSLPRCCG